MRGEGFLSRGGEGVGEGAQLDNFLILRDSESIYLHAQVGRDSLPSLSYKGHRLPSFQEPQIWGKAGSPNLEQTPGTFEQGGSPVNDLWIQGVSHLPRGAARPFRCPHPPLRPCPCHQVGSWKPGPSLRNVEWPLCCQ